MTAEKHNQSLILHAIQSGKHDSDTKRTANTAKALSKYVYKLTNSVFSCISIWFEHVSISWCIDFLCFK